jgi:hypothetical protein
MNPKNDHSEMIHKENSQTALNLWLWVIIFSMAFAWVESAVVVYLRTIYFDGGFRFPLAINYENGKHVFNPLVRIELGREIATIIILLAVGILAGKKRFHQFCFFMIAFGVWDIFYYIWLYVMVGWPQSLMTWDLLFYVPLPWVGPVITPVLIAMAMVAAGSLILYFEAKGYEIQWRWYDMVVELGCALLMIIAFCWDWKNILQVPGDLARTGIPNPFAWWLYLPAYGVSILYFAVRLKQSIIRDNR